MRFSSTEVKAVLHCNEFIGSARNAVIAFTLLEAKGQRQKIMKTACLTVTGYSSVCEGELLAVL
jgi:hypothetical protein